MNFCIQCKHFSGDGVNSATCTALAHCPVTGRDQGARNPFTERAVGGTCGILGTLYEPIETAPVEVKVRKPRQKKEVAPEEQKDVE